ncbi:acyltransferase family protein [Marinomonas ostreistagni]|uniref:acyltransferase family protein n=1 Tax=Marinomonas ostreistagni TaxID=359209 RepID=UPI00194F6467|nr:acyltransferase [Marinomonas ostreistagni]MBM6550733.1 acyltransferase [Marinomonas ostreistagni]
MTLADFSPSRDNHFTLLRLCCAVGVLLSHSVLVFSGTALPWSIVGIRLDHVFVCVFFAISGFLICRSLHRSQDLRYYACARAARLLPGLIVLLGLTVLVAGPLLTELRLADYFSTASTWRYLLNLNLLDIHTQFQLPGVFQTTPYPHTINASLWTLPIEAWLYVMVAVGFCVLTATSISSTYWLRRRALGLAFIGYVLLSVLGHRALNTRTDDAWVMLIFVCVFLAGAFMYLARHTLVLRFRYALALCIMLWALQHTALLPALAGLAISYTTLTLAYLPRNKMRSLQRLGDYSYGLYIYGFLVQQSVIYLWPELSWPGFVLLSSTVTFACAIASWHLVERPAQHKIKQLFQTKIR